MLKRKEVALFMFVFVKLIAFVLAEAVAARTSMLVVFGPISARIYTYDVARSFQRTLVELAL